MAIMVTALVQEPNEDKFVSVLNKNILEMQEEGLEVEVQYSTSMMYNKNKVAHSALLIGRA